MVIRFLLNSVRTIVRFFCRAASAAYLTVVSNLPTSFWFSIIICALPALRYKDSAVTGIICLPIETNQPFRSVWAPISVEKPVRQQFERRGSVAGQGVRAQLFLILCSLNISAYYSLSRFTLFITEVPGRQTRARTPEREDLSQCALIG